MGGGLPPMPGAQGAAGPPDPANLLEGLGPQPDAQAPPEDRVGAFMSIMKSIFDTLDQLSASHPEASEDVKQAKQFLTNSMTKVATMSPQAQPQQPPTI